MNIGYRNHRIVGWMICMTVCAVAPSSTSAADGQPLHQQIDSLVSKRQAELKIAAAAISDDAEFVRRVHLDLTGVIPTAQIDSGVSR